MSTTTIVKQPNHEEEPSAVEARSPIGPSTKIQLGLIVTLLAMIAGAIWWASKLDTKVDFVVRQISEAMTSYKDTNDRLGKHEKEDGNLWNLIDGRLKTVEVMGSEKTRELEKRLQSLETQMQVWDKLHPAKP